MRFAHLCLVVVVSCFAVSAPAATFVVDSTVDAVDAVPGDGFCETVDGVCTLRAATMEANALAGQDTIEVPAGTYRLTLTTDDPFESSDAEGDLELTGDVVVRGEGPDVTVIDASALGDRVLTALSLTYPDPPTIELEGVALTGGTTSLTGGCVLQRGYGTLTLHNTVLSGCRAQSHGGGIFLASVARRARLVVIDSTIRDNAAVAGGGIDSSWGETELTNTAIVRNRAESPDLYGAKVGGGVYVVGGSLHVVDSLIADNVAERRGGGLIGGQTKIVIERSTISGNVALDTTGGDGVGGALIVERVDLDVLNSTVSGNTAARQGGGIVSSRETNYQVLFSTIADNRSLAGGVGAGMLMIHPPDRPFPRRQVFKGSIIAGNTADGIESNCAIDWPVESDGYNIDGDGTCGLAHATDRQGIDPDLEPLSANGGLGGTHGLMSGSVAIDIVPTDDCFYAYNNDRDQLTDEDPIDGLDNDGDNFFDEDPVDPVDTDQRGVARPIGLGCDAGAFEGEVSVKATIEGFIEEIRGFVDDGEISSRQGRGLIAELQVALWFLKYNGGEVLAAVRLQIFIVKVEGMLARGEVDPELGDYLLTKARAILEMLQ